MKAAVKALFWITAVPLTICSFGVLAFMFKETGWDVPFRWLCLVNLLCAIVMAYYEWRQ